MARTVDGDGTVGTALVDFSHYAFSDFAKPLIKLSRPWIDLSTLDICVAWALTRQRCPVCHKLRAKGFFDKTLPSEEERMRQSDTLPPDGRCRAWCDLHISSCWRCRKRMPI